MTTPPQSFIPALGLKVLTPFYDRLIARSGDEGRWRSAFIRQMNAPDGGTILEIGAGTGSLLAVAAERTGARLVALDPDPQALDIAAAKLQAHRDRLTIIQGFGNDLPDHPALREAAFDRIACCLLLHHLTRPQKQATLRNAYRLLKPGGELHIADWTKPASLKMHLAYLQIRLIDGFATTGDNARGLVPEFMKAAGFTDVAETFSAPSRFGQFGFFRGIKANS